MNDVIIDKEYKENISYINGVNTLQEDSQITTLDMYELVRDLPLASFTQINEEEEDRYVETELGFIGQDLESIDNNVKNLIVDVEKAKRYNIALTCNQNNYINVLAGAMQELIKKVENIEEKIKEL